MADSSRHTSTFAELYRLYNTARSSHILGSTILAQNLLKDSALFVHSNSHQSPRDSSSTSVVPPKRQIHPRDRNPGLFAIMQGAAHISIKTTLAPIERVYMLMQCQNEMLKYGRLSSPYQGIKDCFLRTIKHEGVFSLWRGNSINVIKSLTHQGSMTALVFLKRNGYISKEVREQKQPLWILSLSGMLGLLFSYPLDYARIRLGTDVKAAQTLPFSLDSAVKKCGHVSGNRKFNGVYDVFKKTLRLEGIAGLYRGYTSACFGVFAYQSSQVIDSDYRERKKKEKRASSTKIIENLIFLSLPMVFYPVHTVSHRMMMTSGEMIKYKGAADAIRQIVKHEGASSLYKGVTAYMMYAFANIAIVFALLYLVPLKTNKLDE
ncbi:ADP ATP carrier protein mitochondrial [Bienertia sinuspersici]